MNWKLLKSALEKNAFVIIDVAKYREVLLTFDIITTRPYGVDTVLIPISDIIIGFYSQTCSHTFYHDGYKIKIDFNITDSGVLTVTDVYNPMTSWHPCILRVHAR